MGITKIKQVVFYSTFIAPSLKWVFRLPGGFIQVLDSTELEARMSMLFLTRTKVKVWKWEVRHEQT